MQHVSGNCRKPPQGSSQDGPCSCFEFETGANGSCEATLTDAVQYTYARFKDSLTPSYDKRQLGRPDLRRTKQTLNSGSWTAANSRTADTDHVTNPCCSLTCVNQQFANEIEYIIGRLRLQNAPYGLQVVTRVSNAVQMSALDAPRAGWTSTNSKVSPSRTGSWPTTSVA